MSLAFSEWNTESENFIKSKPKNKTIKKLPSFKKLLNLEETVPNNNKTENFSNSDDDDSGLADYMPNFDPPSPPALSKLKQHKQMEEGGDKKIVEEAYNSNDDSINMEQYNGLDNVSNDQYYKKIASPYFTNTSNTPADNTDNNVIEKLNYLIHLMEEQKDEKTNSVTEELILYTFLGVFIIFVVDSFNKGGGKYTR